MRHRGSKLTIELKELHQKLIRTPFLLNECRNNSAIIKGRWNFIPPPIFQSLTEWFHFTCILPCKTIYLTFNFFELTGKWIFRQIVMFLTVEWTEMDEPLACTLHNTKEPFWYKKWSTTPSPIATCLVLNSDNFDSLLYICSNLKCRRNARQNPLPSSEYIKR